MSSTANASDWFRRMQNHLSRRRRDRVTRPSMTGVREEARRPCPEPDTASLYSVTTVVGDDNNGHNDDFGTRSILSRRSSVSTLVSGCPSSSLSPLSPSSSSSPIDQSVNVGTSVTDLKIKKIEATSPVSPPDGSFLALVRAARNGDAESQIKLGNGFYSGYRMSQSYEDALLWYRRAAEQKSVEGQHKMGHMYFCGLGVAQDFEQAVIWYGLAAERGHAMAQKDLGSCYVYGLGVEKDQVLGVSYHIKSAEQGNPYAQAALGYMYDKGFCVSRDLDLALFWYQKAGCDAGFPTCKEAYYRLLAVKTARGLKSMIFGDKEKK